MATWKREFKLARREAGAPNHLDNKVNSDQKVVNKELSLFTKSHRVDPEPCTSSCSSLSLWSLELSDTKAYEP